jgi:amino acid adenylation domain-containing protein
MDHSSSSRRPRLSPAKQLLLEKRLRGEKDVNTSLQIARLPRPLRLPLSYAQERQWFVDRLEGGSSKYNVSQAWRLRGKLDKESLEWAINTIAERHQSLRTRFAEMDGEPMQVIEPELRIELSLEDLSGLGEGEKQAVIMAALRREGEVSFDLGRGPLIRVKLLRLGEWEHILLRTVHHIVFDAWSEGIFEQEFIILYEAHLEGRKNPLKPLPVQYVDFALWQRSWLGDGKQLEEGLAYWKRHLAGMPERLEFPTDRPRPAVPSFHGAAQRRVLSAALSSELRRLSRKEEVTLFMLLLTGFQLLLAQWSGQTDIAVGTPVVNRPRPELEGLIGLFVNTLVLRTTLSGEQTFLQLLAHVKEVCLAAYTHQNVPFERLVEELNPVRDLSRNALFQTMLTMVNLPITSAKMAGIEIERIREIYEAQPKFDFILYVQDAEQLSLALSYNSDLFDWDSMAEFFEQFELLLSQIVHSPETRISEYSLVREEKLKATPELAKANGASNLFLEFKKAEIEQSITDRFDLQVKRCGHRIAVKTRSCEWTYAELSDRTKRIAREIQARSSADEERVALLFEQEAPMIAGILGTLRAGKTYVPIDPSFPKERIAYLLNDAKIGVILSDGANLQLAKESCREELVVINAELLDQGDWDGPIEQPVSADRLAYILYTSGSTGEPKGVMQCHRNVLHFIRVYTNSLQISEDDRLSLLPSYGFDAAVMDIFGALLNGASLYPIDLRKEGRRDVCEWMEEERITIYHSTPTVYRYLLSELREEAEFKTIRLVVLGGESVYKRDVELFKKHFSENSVFINGFGPTESTVTLQNKIWKDTGIKGETVPIGYPVEGTEVILLNDKGQKGWLNGEIAIVSEHLALGYWARPELTKRAFVEAVESGQKRLYRTGDLGRLLSDGRIEYRGRKDRQVKVRGYRIELGEIEGALSQYPEVSEAAVIVQEDEVKEKRLVAYVVGKEGCEVDVRELSRDLRKRLPEYMVPGDYVKMERMPLTPNGKIDCRALPPPEPYRRELGDTFIAPRTPVEEELARIWGELLGRERVGVDENFFELGGHSLLGSRVISRVQETFKIELPLRSLFEEPTVAGQARNVENALRGGLAGARDVAEILSELNRMTDEEITALLADRLKR